MLCVVPVPSPCLRGLQGMRCPASCRLKPPGAEVGKQTRLLRSARPETPAVGCGPGAGAGPLVCRPPALSPSGVLAAAWAPQPLPACCAPLLSTVSPGGRGRTGSLRTVVMPRVRRGQGCMTESRFCQLVACPRPSWVPPLGLHGRAVGRVSRRTACRAWLPQPWPGPLSPAHCPLSSVTDGPHVPRGSRGGCESGPRRRRCGRPARRLRRGQLWVSLVPVSRGPDGGHSHTCPSLDGSLHGWLWCWARPRELPQTG